MARRLGAERVTHHRRAPQQFGQAAADTVVRVHNGCWVNETGSSEGEGGNANVSLSEVEFWIPREVILSDADDHFVWHRHPGEKFETTGRPKRVYDRRGQLRAFVVPARVAT